MSPAENGSREKTGALEAIYDRLESRIVVTILAAVAAASPRSRALVRAHQGGRFLHGANIAPLPHGCHRDFPRVDSLDAAAEL